MKILFICTHNRCRSILAEAITNHLSSGNVIAKSAGSQPAGEVHPSSIFYLKQVKINVEDLRSESWHIYESWNPDIVITVCDSANREPCPVWFGQSKRMHWSLVDPSKIKNNNDELEQAFQTTIRILKSKITNLLNEINKF